MDIGSGLATSGLVFSEKLEDQELILSATKVLDECSAMRKGFDLIVELLAKQMLVHLLRTWPRDRISASTARLKPQLPWLYMHRATEYMNENGKAGFRLSRLCHEVGLSSSRFIPLFKSSAGMNPHTYYNNLLVFKARRMLVTEGCTTKETAYYLGFRNVSHFCALFHKLTGLSPQEERDGCS
jgi:transcriptional regulator GlxA family with amidase domain